MIFFAKLLRSLEEEEETFQEEANASRQFIISCAFTYHKLHFRLKSCHFESEDYFLTGTGKENKQEYIATTKRKSLLSVNFVVNEKHE